MDFSMSSKYDSSAPSKLPYPSNTMGWQEVNTSFSSKIRHVSPYLASHVAPKSRKLKGPQIMSNWWSKRWSIDSSLSLHVHLQFTRAMYLSIRLFLIRLLIVKNLIQRSCPHKESYYLGHSTVLNTLPREITSISISQNA